jgi:hypothetical protein
MTPLTCQIKGIAQDMDLETGAMTTALVLRLSNGETIKATIEEAVAELVLKLSTRKVEETEPPVDVSTPPWNGSFEPSTETEVAPMPSLPTIENGALPDLGERPVARQVQPPVRKQAVPKDEYGYPIVPQQQPVDTEGLEDEEGGI